MDINKEEKFADAMYRITMASEEYREQIIKKIPASVFYDDKVLADAILSLLKDYVV